MEGRTAGLPTRLRFAVTRTSPMPPGSDPRVDDDLRHRIRRIIGDRTRRGFAGPAAVIGRRGRRTRPGRWCDFQTAVARLDAGSWKEGWNGDGLINNERPIDDDRRHGAGTIEAELALHHAPRRVDTVDDDGDPGPAGNDDIRRPLGERGRNTEGKKQRHRENAHRLSHTNRKSSGIVGSAMLESV
jgi:hypothetical protein